MLEKTLEWGEDYSDQQHSDSLSCPNLDCDRYNSRSIEHTDDKYHSSISIGVRCQGINPRRPYVLVCKCPLCSTKFWFHITRDYAEKLAKIQKKQ